jgi:uncharacterized protein YcaQ
MKLSLAEARQVILKSQGLSGSAAARKRTNILPVIESLGYIQIDTLAVVARAHHHTLWSRIDRYEESILDGLMKDKSIFEYWSHAASFLPISEYRFSLFRKKMYASGKIHWFREDNPKMKKHVLQRIRTEGPLQSRDFEHTRKGPGSWYEWKPAKRALEQLFMEGVLMVAGRKGFQKVYDLAERVFPEGKGMKVPSEKEFCEHLILKAIDSNGLVNPGEISYLRGHTREGVKHTIKQLLKQGAIREITLEGNGIYYGKEERITRLLSGGDDKASVHILSPFDNTVIQRKRLMTFFNFDFFIECYVPEPKRKFGYFCLPVLYGDRFVARFDPKADRSSKTFFIRTFHPEKGWKADAAFAEAFASKLKAFASFSGCDRIVASKEVPAIVRKML